jgi:hypothetical protein
MRGFRRDKRDWAGLLRAVAMAVGAVMLAGAAGGMEATPPPPTVAAPEVALTAEERELWAELYFSAVYAATLSEGAASGIPASPESLDKSGYLVWKPVVAFPLKDAAKRFNAEGILTRKGLLDLQADMARKKHRGEKVLDLGEVVIARSDREVLFAAGVAGAKVGSVEIYGPRTLYVRRNPDGARFYVYRQVLRAVLAFRAAKKDLPVDLPALTAFVGSLNPEAEKKFDLQKMFDEARREVTSR